MTDPQDRMGALEDLVKALAQRLGALEDRLPEARPVEGPRTQEHGGRMVVASSAGDGGGASEPRDGTLSLTGSVDLGEHHYKLRVQESVQPLLDGAPEQMAQVCAALGNPHRIVIVRILCAGPRTALQLQEALGMASVGQLYHHLKDLVATGLVTNQHGSYSIAQSKQMWVYLILMVAYHLAPPPQGDDALVPPVEHQGDEP